MKKNVTSSSESQETEACWLPDKMEKLKKTFDFIRKRLKKEIVPKTEKLRLSLGFFLLISAFHSPLAE